jgi:hypothetical protein
MIAVLSDSSEETLSFEQNVVSLILDSCILLKDINIPHFGLKIFKCSQNKGLITIPAFPALINLTLNDCLGLEHLPSFQCLETLNIDTCPKLMTILEQPALLILNCCNCAVLEKIVSHPSLLNLTVVRCFNFSEFSTQPNLEQLNITTCFRLKSMPVLDKLCYKVTDSIQYNSLDTKYFPSLKGSFIDEEYLKYDIIAHYLVSICGDSVALSLMHILVDL